MHARTDLNVPSSPRRGLRRACALFAAVAAAASPALPGSAQELPGPITLEIERQPLWHGTGDELGLRIRIRNEGTLSLSGFRVALAAYDRVATRSELAASADIDPRTQFPPSSFSRDFDSIVPAGAELAVTLDDPIATLDTLERATESGVYPIVVSVLAADGVNVLGRVTTPLLYYPKPVEVPLNAVPVVPVNDFAGRGPEGAFTSGSPDGTTEIEAAIAPDGWLPVLIETLMDHVGDGLRIGLAPTPRLVDELEDMADGYRRDAGSEVRALGGSSPEARAARLALQGLSELLGRRGVQPLLVPYSFADLPSVATLGFELLNDEVALAQQTLAGALDLEISRRWLLPPAGRLDATSLGALHSIPETAGRSFFVAGALEQPLDPALAGCPGGSPTFACPVTVTTVEGTSVGYQSDGVLQDHLAALGEPGDDRLDLQRFFAETAMIREELPGVGTRVIQFTLPALFHPSPEAADLLFKGLATAPWLNTVTPLRGLKIAPDRVAKEVVDPPRPAPNEPGPEYFDALTEARSVVEQFALVGPPASLIERLQRDLLVAHSRNWWADVQLVGRGLAFATNARGEAEHHLERISVLGAPDITMTSRRGEIQLLLSNENDFPVTVAVRLSSPDLRFAGGGVVVREFPPKKTTPVTLAATALSSGVFQVEVRVETPRGESTIFGPTSISIRSTELNRVAVGITLGALLFLVAFYVFRSLGSAKEASVE